jgi:hypothetical protein
LKAGDTFILTSLDHHLRIIVSDPQIDPDQIVIVNMTECDKDGDCSCQISIGDHPFVTKRSVISYRDGSIVTLKKLHEISKKGLIKHGQPVSDKLLDRIRQGAFSSDFLPENCRRILEEQPPF